MRTVSSLVAVASLFGAVALTPVIGGVLFAFVLFGLFLLALVGVMAGLEDRTVRQRNPELDPTGWRNAREQTYEPQPLREVAARGRAKTAAPAGRGRRRATVSGAPKRSQQEPA